jgi:hypothetical protein
MSTTNKKSLKDHFTIAEVVKALLVISAAFGATSVTSDTPAVGERLAIVETRIDPLMSALEENTRVVKALQKTQDSLLIEFRVHMRNDDK